LIKPGSPVGDIIPYGDDVRIPTGAQEPSQAYSEFIFVIPNIYNKKAPVGALYQFAGFFTTLFFRRW
jgi:hypothetical protein